MATEGLPKRQLIIILIAGLIIVFGILGIWCLCSVHTINIVTQEIQYMDKCKDFLSEEQPRCANFTPSVEVEKCDCFLEFTLEQNLDGAVTLYYELVDFDQKKSTYAKSRDDNQLKGNVEAGPAASCGNFSFNEDKPIFPCGEIADSMFNDTYTELRQCGNLTVEVPVLYTKLFTEDTPAYKNPPEDKLNDYTTPIHWERPRGKNPWEEKTDLKGVENPAFQAWMNTSLTRKPVWRVDPSGNFSKGLPAGNYSLRITIYYGVDRYPGVRKLIFEGVNELEPGPRSLAWGIVLLLLSLSGIVLAILYFVYNKYQNKTSSENAAATPSNDKETPLLNRLRDRIRKHT